MRRHLGRMAALVLFGLVGCASSDKDNLQGTWVMESMERLDEKETADKFGDLKLVFAGEKVTILGKGKSKDSTYTLDTTKSPKTITIAAPEGEKRGMNGIYTFEGDKLKICVSMKDGDLPTNFNTGKDFPSLLMIYKREK